ncbi:MAG: hypothetical protein WAM39_12540 [Bryobacteraceae bacterium]
MPKRAPTRDNQLKRQRKHTGMLGATATTGLRLFDGYCKRELELVRLAKA